MLPTMMMNSSTLLSVLFFTLMWMMAIRETTNAMDVSNNSSRPDAPVTSIARGDFATCG